MRGLVIFGKREVNERCAAKAALWWACLLLVFSWGAGSAVPHAAWAQMSKPPKLSEDAVPQGGDFMYFPALPADRLLQGDYATYLRHLKAQDCLAALALLNKATLKRYPNLAHAARDKPGYRFWLNFLVPEKYPGAALCLFLQKLRHIQREIELFALHVPPFDDRKPPAKHTELSPRTERNSSLRQIMFLASVNNYALAYLALAEIILDGKTTVYGPEVAYFLLLRAQHLGADEAALRPRLKALAATLPPATQARLARQATAAHWPGLRSFAPAKAPPPP